MATHFSYFSKNGQILPIEQAQIPLNNIAYSYGFGVYETLKIRHGIVYFLKQHVDRLIQSANLIGLSHGFSRETITNYLAALVTSLDLNQPDAAGNLKMLLIGGKEPLLFILPLAPLFPDRKLYSEGAKTITVAYERNFPQAKTLNMLGSYIAYQKAKEQGCYDALIVTKAGAILEGTRTNFFAIQGKELFTPPAEEVLEGVTRQTVIHAAKKHGFVIHEAAIPLAQITDYDGAFVTSTSSKIVPIRQIDEHTFQIPETLRELMHTYDNFLKESKGVFLE